MGTDLKHAEKWRNNWQSVKCSIYDKLNFHQNHCDIHNSGQNSTGHILAIFLMSKWLSYWTLKWLHPDVRLPYKLKNVEIIILASWVTCPSLTGHYFSHISTVIFLSFICTKRNNISFEKISFLLPDQS